MEILEEQQRQQAGRLTESAAEGSASMAMVMGHFLTTSAGELPIKAPSLASISH
jgi:hypothetical protein